MTNHARCRSGSHSRTSGGIKNACSRSHSIKLCAMPGIVLNDPDATPTYATPSHERGTLLDTRSAPAVDESRSSGPAPSGRLLRPGGAGAPGRSRSPCDRSEPQPSAGRHHRRAACPDGSDDLLGVDPLEIDRGGAEIQMPELALDDVKRDALAREFERVRVAQLVRRKPAPDPGPGGESAELRADRGLRPWSAAGGAVDHAEQRPDWELRPCAQPRP